LLNAKLPSDSHLMTDDSVLYANNCDISYDK